MFKHKEKNNLLMNFLNIKQKKQLNNYAFVTNFVTYL